MGTYELIGILENDEDVLARYHAAVILDRVRIRLDSIPNFDSKSED